MKLIIGFLVLVFSAWGQLGPGLMKNNIVFIAGKCAGSADANSATTAAVNAASANFSVVSAVSNDSNTANVAVSDSSSNTYTKLTNRGPDAGNGNIYPAYKLAATTTSSFTATVSEGSAFPSVCVGTFSGVKTASAFGTETGTTSALATTFQPGSQTPAKAGDLVMTGVEFGTSVATMSINSGFTIIDQVAFSGGLHYPNALAYLISPAGAAVNPTWTSSTSVTASLFSCTFSAY